MTTTTSSVATHDATATDRLSALATKPLWLIGVGAVVAGAVVVAVFAAIASAAGVPLEVASESGGTPEAIPVAGFGTMVLAAGAIGVLLALALNRWTTRPARAFPIVATVLTVASFATPFMAQEATTATRIVLFLAHVVAAGVIIPLITTRLAQGSAEA